MARLNVVALTAWTAALAVSIALWTLIVRSCWVIYTWATHARAWSLLDKMSSVACIAFFVCAGIILADGLINAPLMPDELEE